MKWTESSGKIIKGTAGKRDRQDWKQESVKTDCRIIVATNKNLKEEVKKGKFREDFITGFWDCPSNSLLSAKGEMIS